MKYYIMAPAGITSGGPELAHQMCAQINKNGEEALMYYICSNYNNPVDCECEEKYRKYNTEHAKCHGDVDIEDNIIIVPESFTDFIPMFENARIVLWWMSVDNFFKEAVNTNVEEINKRVEIHLVQSKYAEVFLSDNNIETSKIMTVSDYIGELYGQFILPSEYRKNIILYNPKKITDDLKCIMEKTSFFEWRQLVNLTEEEMIVLMEMAKVYIDFGHHPGKDRIPREAALCGCCIVTNKRGSAMFDEDVAIPPFYKIDTSNDYLDKTVEVLLTIINNFDSSSKDFDEYRNIIKSEHAKFEEDVRVFMEKCQNKQNM